MANGHERQTVVIFLYGIYIYNRLDILLAFIFLASMVGAIVTLPALVRWLMMRRHDTLIEVPPEAV